MSSKTASIKKAKENAHQALYDRSSDESPSSKKSKVISKGSSFIKKLGTQVFDKFSDKEIEVQSQEQEQQAKRSKGLSALRGLMKK